MAVSYSVSSQTFASASVLITTTSVILDAVQEGLSASEAQRGHPSKILTERGQTTALY